MANRKRDRHHREPGGRNFSAQPDDRRRGEALPRGLWCIEWSSRDVVGEGGTDRAKGKFGSKEGCYPVSLRRRERHGGHHQRPGNGLVHDQGGYETIFVL